MANGTPIIGGPPMGEIVSNEVQEALVLTGRGFGSLRLSQGFGGVSDPSVIWSSMIGDRQDAYYFMRELEEKDEDIGTHIETLKLAVLGQTASVLPGDESTGAGEIAKQIEAILCRIPNWHNVLYQLLDAAPYGCSISEINYGFEVVNKKFSVVINSIEDRPQELFTFNARWLPQIGPLRFLRNVYDVSGGELVPEEKFIVNTHRPRSGNRRGRPLLRSVFWPSWFKRQALRMWLRFAEKGPGTAVVKYTAGNSDEAQKALQAAEDIIERVAVAVPENFEIVHELLNSARATSPETYSKLVERMEMSITRRLVGQTLTTRGSEGGAGSRALGGVHQNIFDLIWTALAKDLEATINDRVVKPLVIWNYGPDAPMPKWSLAVEEEENLLDRSQVDDRLQQMGFPITKNYVMEKYGMPEPEDGEEVLERVQAQPAGGGFGGDGDGADPESGAEDKTDMNEQPKDLEDVKRMIAQMKEKSFDVFKARVLALTEEARVSKFAAKG